MGYLRLAMKNLLRRRLRSALTLLGIAAAVAILYSLLEFQRRYERGLADEIAQLGAHIMVVPKGCPYEAATIVLHGGKWPRYMDESHAERIKSTPGVDRAAAIIMDAIIDPGSERTEIFLGIDDDYPELRPSWSLRGAGFSGPAAREVILGATVAGQLGLKPGDTFHLRQDAAGRVGGKADADLAVVGALERTGTQDDGLIFLPMRAHQELFQLEGKLVVVLVRATDVDAAAIERLAGDLRALGGNMNVFPLSELLENASQLMQVTRVFVLAVVLVAVAIGAVGVLNTVMMAVFERTREIGMMKAVGASSRDVFGLVWAETILICTAGGLAGVALAVSGARGVESFLRAALSSQFAAMPETTLIGLSPGLMAACVGLSIGLGLLAGFYPAWRASAVRPVEAIRGGS